MTTMRHEEEAHWSARRRRREPTLEDLLPDVLAESLTTSRRGQTHRVRPPRVIPVHRLDRDTSGLMVFARTVAAERSLVEQFREHSIDRSYLAIVQGEIAEQTVESFLARDRGDGKRGACLIRNKVRMRSRTSAPSNSSTATLWLNADSKPAARTKSAFIFPRQGIPSAVTKTIAGRLARSRSLIAARTASALHAAELGFEHPLTGESLHFETRLPRDLSDFLKQLRRT